MLIFQLLHINLLLVVATIYLRLIMHKCFICIMSFASYQHFEVLSIRINPLQKWGHGLRKDKEFSKDVPAKESMSMPRNQILKSVLHENIHTSSPSSHLTASYLHLPSLTISAGMVRRNYGF